MAILKRIARREGSWAAAVASAAHPRSARFRRPVSRRTLALVWAGMGLACLLPASSAPAREYELKAVFLFNFAQFVEWPVEAFASSEAPFIVGVLGENPFGTSLEEMLRDESVQQRKIRLQFYARPEDIQRCHILFIARPESSGLASVLLRLQGQHTLTVGESEGFATAGGVIQFLTENNRIRVQINLPAATREKLIISSKLLRLAKLVQTRDEP